MAVRESSPLGLPLRGPQHRREIKSRIDDNAVLIGNLKKCICLPVEDVREVIAARECPFLQRFAFGYLIASVNA